MLAKMTKTNNYFFRQIWTIFSQHVAIVSVLISVPLYPLVAGTTRHCLILFVLNPKHVASISGICCYSQNTYQTLTKGNDSFELFLMHGCANEISWCKLTQITYMYIFCFLFYAFLYFFTLSLYYASVGQRFSKQLYIYWWLC